MKETNGFQSNAGFNRAFKTGMLLMTGLIGLLALFALHLITASWELDTLTFRQKFFSATPSDRSKITPIQLITLDNHTVTSDIYQRHFKSDFSREAAAYAIRFLRRTQPKAVLFDLSFDGGIHYDDLAGDTALAHSLDGTSRFASMLDFDIKYDPTLSFEGQSADIHTLLSKNAVQVHGLNNFPVYEKLYSFDSLRPPYPLLAKAPMRFFSANSLSNKTSLNIINNSENRDTEARRWIPFSIYGGSIYPTAPLGLLLGDEKQLSLSKDGQLSWHNGHIDLGTDGVPLIRWYGQGINKDLPVYPEISFLDVVLSELALECSESHHESYQQCQKAAMPTGKILSPNYFKDKYVLIGINLPYGNDKHTTIYGPNYSGIYIIANILDNAIHNDFVHKAPIWLDIICLLLLPGVLLFTIYRYQSAWLSLIVGAALALGHFLFTLYAYSQWNLWIAFVEPFLAVVVCFCGTYAYQYSTEHKKRQQMRYAFGKYVSPSVLQIIEKNPDKITLGGERREMTFLFSDIRGFTTFSDQNPPEQVQLFLTQYFSTMNKIILHAYHGSINKLIGDAIMAYWGFPLQHEDHAFLAVSAALAMRDAMMEWQNDSSKMPITIGIGINTGEAVIGNIGSEDFMDFTVIGDAVNVASRLEGSNKEYGTNIIISAATYEKVKDRIRARRLGWAELKGKEAKVEIYEPLGFL